MLCQSLVWQHPSFCHFSPSYRFVLIFSWNVNELKPAWGICLLGVHIVSNVAACTMGLDRDSNIKWQVPVFSTFDAKCQVLALRNPDKCFQMVFFSLRRMILVTSNSHFSSDALRVGFPSTACLSYARFHRPLVNLCILGHYIVINPAWGSYQWAYIYLGHPMKYVSWTTSADVTDIKVYRRLKLQRHVTFRQVALHWDWFVAGRYLTRRPMQIEPKPDGFLRSWHYSNGIYL